MLSKVVWKLDCLWLVAFYFVYHFILAGPCFGDRDSPTANDGLLVFENRIILSEMRSGILALIHDEHLGIAKCRDRAKQTAWWPGINKDIQTMSEGCRFCISQKSKQRSEPLRTTLLPDRPWQRVASDLCEHKNQQFLVVVDYYSRYWEIAHLPKTRRTDVITKPKSIFARFGVPEVLVTDRQRAGVFFFGIPLLQPEIRLYSLHE